MATDRDIADGHIQILGRLRNDRSMFDEQWEEVAKRVLPGFSGTFYGHGQHMRTPGEKHTEVMYDSTASRDLLRFMSAMESYITPQTQKWHRLKASDDSLNQRRRVQLWFEKATNTLFRYRYASRANFVGQKQLDYMSSGAFGNGSLYIDRLDGRPGVRYKFCPPGTTYWMVNHQGIVDTIYRVFNWSPRQVVDKWGDEVPAEIRSRLKTHPEKEDIEIIHVVEPNRDQDPQRADYRGMPYTSLYIGVKDHHIFERGGYRSFPYTVSRYILFPGENYGRGPGIFALPDIKTLNQITKTVLKQGHRSVDPVILAHDDGILDSFSLRPGYINAGTMSADGKPLVGTLPVGNLAAGLEHQQQAQANIHDHFLITLFQILVDHPQMTATEVLERAQEKGALLSPTFGRQQSETLGPQIKREINLLVQQGLLPEPPPELIEAEDEYEIEYDSPLSRAQRAEEAAGMMRSVEFALQWATSTGQMDPLDWFDTDVIIPEVQSISGMPASWTRSVEAVAQLRKSRAQQAQAEQLANAAPGVAALMKAQQDSG